MPQTDRLASRAIALASTEPGVATGWLEDNFHHFGVRITHDGSRVSDVEVSTVRYPWTTCAGAGEPARDIIGMDLFARAEMLGAELPMAMHCTHVFELAGLVIAHACRGEDDRFIQMDVTLAEASGGEPMKALACTWTCNDVAGPRLLAEGGIILEPSTLAGKPLYKGFRVWATSIDPVEAERLWLMRRVVWLAEGADMFTPRAVADDTGLGHVCHTYQPEQRHRARSISGSRIDVNDPENVLLADQRASFRR